MGNVSMTIEEYEDMKLQRYTAENEAARLQKELVAARMLSSSGESLEALTKLTRDSLAITRFAIANLPPETIRGWPYETLREIASKLPLLPDYTVDDRDLSGEMIAFAAECQRHEVRRKSQAGQATTQAITNPS